MGFGLSDFLNLIHGILSTIYSSIDKFLDVAYSTVSGLIYMLGILSFFIDNPVFSILCYELIVIAYTVETHSGTGIMYGLVSGQFLLLRVTWFLFETAINFVLRIVEVARNMLPFV